MRMRKIILLLVLTLSLFQAGAIRVKGSAAGYAGQTLEFFTLSDPVTRTPLPFFSLTIDPSGNFSAEVPVTSPCWCYADFGIFRGRLVLEPGKEVTLQLPPLREKSFEESKNPYFEPVEIWLKSDDGSGRELSGLVSRYDTRFFQLTDTYFTQIYHRQMKSYVDTIRGRLDREFGKNENSLFREHARLRMSGLEADVMRAGREKMAGSLKGLSQEAWQMPAFADFLNRLFTNSLSTESKSPAGSRLRMWVARGDMTALRKWTGEFTAAVSPLADLILLKMLHDAWYSGEFSKTAIPNMVASPYFTAHNTPAIRDMAARVAGKIAFLLPGTPAPEICLPPAAGTPWCSTTSSRPFLYILFADLEIPICQEQVKYLKTVAEKTGGKVQFLTVLSPSEKISNEEFMSRHQIPGIMVTDTPHRESGREYKVRSYPSAFLLDRQHRVILAPARTPLDGFEFQFEDMKK